MDSCPAIQGDKDETKIIYEKRKKIKSVLPFPRFSCFERRLCDGSVAGIYAED